MKRVVETVATEPEAEPNTLERSGRQVGPVASDCERCSSPPRGQELMHGRAANLVAPGRPWE